jgi:transposase
MIDNLFDIERIDDVPLLFEQLKTMGVIKLFDKHFPPHPTNWVGNLTPGEVIACWLCFIVSRGNHRVSHVEGWAEQRLHLLEALTGKTVRPLDFSDDRLAQLLNQLGDEQAWPAFEQELSGELLRVYELNPQVVRLDSTTAKTYAGVNEEGLFQFGHSKDHRPDLAQVKISMSSLDPLGLTLSTTVVGGNSADDPLYEPEITQVRKILGKRTLLYVGDKKMGGLETRAFIVVGEDFYLCPLGLKQLSESQRERLIEELFAKQYEPQIIIDPKTNQPIGLGFEMSVERTARNSDGDRVAWSERILAFSPFERALREAKELDEAIESGQRELLKLNERKQGKKCLDAEQTAQACAQIVKRHGIEGILNWRLETQVFERQVRGWKGRPGRTESQQQCEVKVELDLAALLKRRQDLAWSFYATNSNQEQLPLVRAVFVYRGQYTIEQGMGRLKGCRLGVSPLFLRLDSHVAGLIHLLVIGLRLLCLVQFVVRRQLAAAESESERQIKGLYKGQASRATTQPTTESMLTVFEGLSLMIERNEKGQTVARLTQLKDLHRRILDLLGFSQEIYLRLVTYFKNLALE